jgi:hypothetical protein
MHVGLGVDAGNAVVNLVDRHGPKLLVGIAQT